VDLLREYFGILVTGFAMLVGAIAKIFHGRLATQEKSFNDFRVEVAKEYATKQEISRIEASQNRMEGKIDDLILQVANKEDRK